LSQPIDGAIINIHEVCQLVSQQKIHGTGKLNQRHLTTTAR
jgi:hypothetical protein